MTELPAHALATDTSVAIPLVVATHPDHRIVTAWARSRFLVLAGHAAVETYSVLTRLPDDLRVDPQDATMLLSARFNGTIVVPPDETRAAPQTLADAGIFGGAVYDGLVALAAVAHDLPLASRDARARPTYERLDVRVVTVG